MNHNKTIAKVCNAAPVIPVVTISRIEDARPIAHALVAGGLPCLEITLRTKVALDAIAAVADVEDVIVGAGTLITSDQVNDAKEAGAVFGVSPGFSTTLIDATKRFDLPLLPGSSTASEAMQLLEKGFSYQKFFPAESSGGFEKLRSLAEALPQITFCPTGGVTSENAQKYLKLPNIICVGGSWITPNALVSSGDWKKITQIARHASALLE